MVREFWQVFSAILQYCYLFSNKEILIGGNFMNGTMINSYERIKFRWDNIPKELKCPKDEEWQIKDNEALIYNESKIKNDYIIRQRLIKYAKIHNINLLEASRAVLKELRAKNKAKIGT